MNKQIKRLTKRLKRKGYNTEIHKSKTTDSIYLICHNEERYFEIRFSDHELKENKFIDRNRNVISISPDEHSFDAVIKNIGVML